MRNIETDSFPTSQEAGSTEGRQTPGSGETPTTGLQSEKEVALASPETQDHQGSSRERPSSQLPVVCNPAFGRHWHAGDEGGAELMTAAFGTSARPVPRRSEPLAISSERSPIRAAVAVRPDKQPPGRMRATLVLLLLALAILMAQPAASLIGRL